MKKLIILFIAFGLLLTACEGEDGLDADQFAALSFETQEIDFQFSNDTGLQEAIVELPFDILDSDVVLVFRFEGTVEIDGQPTEVWSPLPQNFFLEGNDIIQYVFNHTFADVELLIDGNFDLSTLGAEFTQSQVFRIVTLPAIALNSIDVNDTNAVMALGGF